MPRLRFRRFRHRLLVFVLGLLALVQGAVFLAVNATNVSEARRGIADALEITASAFRRSLETREQILVEKARLLSADFAFKEATATGDHSTILSALDNHRARVGGDVMLLLAFSGEVMADTLHPADHGILSPIEPLLEQARADEFGETSSLWLLEGEAYQLVVVPLFMPEPRAWIVIGFRIGDAFANELKQETRTEVSLLKRGAGHWETLASTLPDPARRVLEHGLPREAPTAPHETTTISLDRDQYISWITPLVIGGVPVIAVLQRSLDEALSPLQRLRVQLAAIFLLGLGLSVVGAAALAGRVTRPVSKLARGVRRIEAGDYAEPVDVTQADELGTLARSFNDMMVGLAERDAIRDLLGRVVAPPIAEELLRTKIELGGEEREVTILFTDIRDFTSIAEREPPQRLVKMLNTLLTGVSQVIEARGGVVEDFLGDGVKALFGAPVAHGDDAQRAVLAALDLRDSLPQINSEIVTLGGDPLAIGTGINTATVVAGKMGSLSRLKYTVVGDGVNLASRLEGLTKRYGVDVVVSDATVQACPELVFRELDRVRVKGRRGAVGVWEPVGTARDVDAEQRDRLRHHGEALQRYRARDWDGAEARLVSLSQREPTTQLYRIYLERIARFRTNPPEPDWDGTVTYDEK